MKKGFCTLLALILTVTLCSCGNSDTTSEDVSINDYSTTNEVVEVYEDESESENSSVETESSNVVDVEETVEEKAMTALESLSVWTGSVAESFGGGSGTANDPYLISTAEQLAKLASDVNSGVDFSGNYFVLTSDIMLNDISGWNFSSLENNTEYAYAWTNQWSPIGLNYGFSGSFDGAGYTIYGLYNSNVYYRYGSTASADIGLFGEIDGGSVSNVEIACAYISLYAGNAGAIAGELGYKDSISNCHVQQTIIINGGSENSVKIGGICGDSDGSITMCSFSGLLQCPNGTFKSARLGGIAGYSTNEISDCFTNITINVDVTFSADLSNSASRACVYAGGICGDGTGEDTVITNCYSTVLVGVQAMDALDYTISDVELEPDVALGGVVGYCRSSIFNCGAKGEINYSGDITETYLGGIVGLLGNQRYSWEGELTNCYSNVELSDATYAGGIVGAAAGEYSVTNSYYDSDYALSGIGASITSNVFTNNISGYAEEELRDSSNYYDWDFASTWFIDSSVNEGFPVPLSLVSYVGT